MLPIALGLMTAIALAFLLRPILRRDRVDAGREAYDVEVYRAQLQELDREIERGIVDEDEADAARAEIGRRLLAADTARAKAASAKAPPRTLDRMRKITAGALAVLVPAAALGVYLLVGSPALPDRPLAARQGEGGTAAMRARMEAIAKALEARLKTSPDDVDALGRLGRIYLALNRHDDGARVLKRAVDLRPKDAALAAAYGEALVFANERTVSPEAKAVFERVLTLDAKNRQARFYLGLAKAQSGDRMGALKDWIALEADAPADAPWRVQLTRFIDGAAREAGVKAETLAEWRKAAADKAPTTALGPRRSKPAPPQAGTTGIPKEQMEMIRGMVESLAERLKENPNDLAGWRRLGRSYMVLREPKKAEAAYAKAAELAPKNVAVLVDYGQAMLAAHGKDYDLPQPFVALMKRIHAIDERNAVALWFLGLAAHEAGNKAEAASLWERLLERIPKNAPERAALVKRIEMLKMKDK